MVPDTISIMKNMLFLSKTLWVPLKELLAVSSLCLFLTHTWIWLDNSFSKTFWICLEIFLPCRSGYSYLMIDVYSNSWDPVTVLTGEKPWLLEMFLIPRSKIGRASTQFCFLVIVFAFNIQCCSMSPLVWERSAFVHNLLKPVILDNSRNSSFSNCFPLSVSPCMVPQSEKPLLWEKKR